MTLKKMLQNTTIDHVMDALLIAYPECLVDKQNYISVLRFLLETPAYPFDDFVISVNLIDPSEDEAYEEDIDEEAYLSISGYSKVEDLHFALGFSRWEEWANAEIIMQEDLDIDSNELISMLLYEMTFYGFDQETIATELNDLEKGIMLH